MWQYESKDNKKEKSSKMAGSNFNHMIDNKNIEPSTIIWASWFWRGVQTTKIQKCVTYMDRKASYCFWFVNKGLQ